MEDAKEDTPIEPGESDLVEIARRAIADGPHGAIQPKRRGRPPGSKTRIQKTDTAPAGAEPAKPVDPRVLRNAIESLCSGIDGVVSRRAIGKAKRAFDVDSVTAIADEIRMLPEERACIVENASVVLESVSGAKYAPHFAFALGLVGYSYRTFSIHQTIDKAIEDMNAAKKAT